MLLPTAPPYLAYEYSMVFGQVSRKSKTLEYMKAMAQKRAQRQRQRARLTVYSYGTAIDDSHIYGIGRWSGDVTKIRPKAFWKRFPESSLPLEAVEVQTSPDLSDLSRLPGQVTMEYSQSTTAFPLFLKSLLRAWLFGAALLALMLVVVRAVNKCLDAGRKKRKARRRSQEWPTPNVRATNRDAEFNGTVIIPDFDNLDPYAVDQGNTANIDFPPPYSEYTDTAPIPSTSYAHKETDIIHEEPPPPYSDCYVEFSNKNGIPSVLIFNRKRPPLVSRREILGSEIINNDQNKDNNAAENNASIVPTFNVVKIEDTSIEMINESNPTTSGVEDIGDEVESRKVLQV